MVHDAGTDSSILDLYFMDPFIRDGIAKLEIEDKKIMVQVVERITPPSGFATTVVKPWREFLNCFIEFNSNVDLTIWADIAGLGRIITKSEVEKYNADKRKAYEDKMKMIMSTECTQS